MIFRNSLNPEVTGNTITLIDVGPNGAAGGPISALYLIRFHDGTITGNDFSGQRNPGWGGITFHNNNFHNNTNHVLTHALSTGNVFTSTDSTIGGNWWDTYDEISEGCNPVGNFCGSPLILAGGIGTDFQPWTSMFTIGGSGDSDNDGVPDDEDAFPNDPSESVDTDGDGIGNNADTDDDGDGVADANDPFPLDATESVDTDGDGIGNNADTDDDGDGVSDADEIINGTHQGRGR